MKIAITGGAGFLGYHVARLLEAEGHDLTLVDNLFRSQIDASMRRLLERPRVSFQRADLTSSDLNDALGTGFDIVFHLAAINGTRNFYERPFEVLRVNLLTTLRVFEWVAAGGARTCAWTSSAEAYAGALENGIADVPTPEEVPLTITDVANPRFSYAASKVAGEAMANALAHGGNVRVVTIRPHNLYGPRMGHDHVIPQFIDRALDKTDPFRVYGPKQTRAFCYVEDAARGLVKAARKASRVPSLFHIGDDRQEVQMGDLARRVCRLIGHNPRFQTEPAPKGSVARRCPDISRARNRLAYEPRVELDEGLRRTIGWYTANRLGEELLA